MSQWRAQGVNQPPYTLQHIGARRATHYATGEDYSKYGDGITQTIECSAAMWEPSYINNIPSNLTAFMTGTVSEGFLLIPQNKHSGYECPGSTDIETMRSVWWNGNRPAWLVQCCITSLEVKWTTARRDTKMRKISEMHKEINVLVGVTPSFYDKAISVMQAQVREMWKVSNVKLGLESL